MPPITDFIPLFMLLGAWSLMSLTWVFYLAAMSLIPLIKMGGNGWFFNIFAYPAVVTGFVLDAALNLMMSVVLLDIPREWLLTGKLRRLKMTEPDSWRGRVAFYFCEKFLNPFDPSGFHC